MPAPSHVPAAELTKIYRKLTRKNTAPIPDAVAQDLEKIAEYFAAKALLVPTFINKLLPRGPFLRQPNAGHYAIADFLATGIVDFVVSTNFDALTEVAAEDLGEGQAFVALDAAEANIPRLHRQHVKLHGCLRRKDDETVCCKSQLSKELLRSRLSDLDTWLRAHLVGRDVVFLGFWSDWSYLNEIFEKSIHAIEGGLVVIVNRRKSPHSRRRTRAWSGNGQ
ncbi:MAG: SIR2 family protein [Bryobacteraceae bacterium]